MNEAKPFSISKQEVWDPYQRVKANQGAAGVDAQSITEFEEDLKDNLYKEGETGTKGRATLSSQLVRVSSWPVRIGCGWAGPAALLGL